MRSLFESLAWQALGRAPEITPVPNRAHASNIEADGFDLLSSSSDRSWHELSNGNQSNPEMWPAEEDEWRVVVEPPLMEHDSPALPSTPPESDVQPEKAVGTPQNISEPEVKPDADPSAVAYTFLPKHSMHAASHHQNVSAGSPNPISTSAANTAFASSRIASSLPAQAESDVYVPHPFTRRQSAPPKPPPFRINIEHTDIERTDIFHSRPARARRNRPIAGFTLDQYLKQRSRSR